MFGNYYGYQSYQNPYQQQQYTQQVVRVSGENGARAYQLPANSSILLLDDSEPIVWLKTTDGAGYPTITPYKIEAYTKPQEASDILRRIEKLEEYVSEQSNIRQARHEEQ